MAARVATVWPTFIGDAGKERKFVVLWPGDHLPSWGSLNRPGGDHYTSRIAAQAYVDRVNGVAADEWRETHSW